MILIYAFSNRWGTNISRRVFSDLQQLLPPGDRIVYQPVYFHPRDFFQKYIKRDHYSLIIGLGDYYGQSPKIRIETLCHNVYDDKPISSFSPISLDISLPNLDNYSSDTFAIGSHMGNYNCNWIAYQTQLFINNYSPTTNQLFLHLPKKANSSQLALRIFDLLSINKVLK